MKRVAFLVAVLLVALLASCEQPVVERVVYVTPNRAPTVETYDAAVTVGQTVTLVADAYDPDGDPLTVTWSGAFDAEGTTVEWTPTDEGEYAVTVVASDGTLTASDGATIEVGPEPWTTEPLHIYIFDCYDELYLVEETTADMYDLRLRSIKLGVEMWNSDGDPGSPFTVVGGGLP